MKMVPLGAGIALAVFLVLRRRRLEPTLLVGGALAVVGLLVYGSGLVHLPNVQKLLEDAGGVLGNWTYLVVGVAAFLETGAFVGLIAPGETFLIFGGVVAGQGRINIIALIAIVWACAVAGDVASFVAGRRLGRAFLVRHGPKVSISEERLHMVEAFFDRHGGKAILIGRFVGLVRAIAPFLAGSSGLAFRRFIPYDVIGAGAWATSLLLIGYIFWRSFDRVLHIAEQGALGLAVAIGLIVGAIAAVRWVRVPENRARTMRRIEREAERPALRPVAAVVRPLWRGTRGPRRFVLNRVTPGDLGLEITTLAAVAAVGSFAFIGEMIVLQDVTYTTGDLRAFDWVREVRGPTTTDVSKFVTTFGSLTVVGIATCATAIMLAARRRFIESGALLVGLLLTFVAVQFAKDAEDRPRPSGSLVDTAGASYPSGHAAYAVTWVAIAVVLGRTVPGLGRMTALVTGGLVVAVLIGLSRVTLRAHYLSDVVGGWGLAATIFAMCGIGALVVAYVRHNGRRA
jgi:membrane protein DedA with SNARE-associated domain/membrane-associated phospholipid phosphatase